MQLRSIILAVLSVLIVFVFLKLVLDTQGSAAPAIEDAELEKALSRYRQEQVQSTRTSPTLEYVEPRRSRSVRPADYLKAEKEPESIPEPTPVEEEEVFTDQVALKNQMNDANRFYDKADYIGARDAAMEVLGEHPDNVRMLRIVVSSSCIMAEEEMARRYYESLPDRDQRQMARRCARYGIEFEEQQ